MNCIIVPQIQQTTCSVQPSLHPVTGNVYSFNNILYSCLMYHAVWGTGCSSYITYSDVKEVLSMHIVSCSHHFVIDTAKTSKVKKFYPYMPIM